MRLGSVRAHLWSQLLGLGAACAGFLALFAGGEVLPVEGPEPAMAIGFEVEFGPVDGPYVDARPSRQVALLVAAGESASPWLPPGPFQARWRGMLEMPSRDRVAWSFEGRGAAEIWVDGAKVWEDAGPELGAQASAPTRLDPGARAIEVRYRSPDTGEARLRLFWQGRAFPRETLAPRMVRHQSAAESRSRGDALRMARSLWASHRCSHCHGPKEGPSAAMDLLRGAPDLSEVYGRMRPAEIARWVLDPHSVRPETGMPALLPYRTLEEARAAGDRRIDDLVAWFAGELVPQRPPFTAGDAARGGALFADSGCIGCHQRPNDSDPEDPEGRLPLAHVGRKFRPGALAQFLLDPAAHHPMTQMPNFGFTAAEAQDLETWLTQEAQPAEATGFEGDAAKGRAVALSLGCQSCHTLPGEAVAPAAPRFPAPERKGCLAEQAEDRGAAPWFSLRPEDAQALQALIAAGPSALQRAVPSEDGPRWMEELRCATCHSLDGHETLWTRFESEVSGLAPAAKEGELAQTRPELTWVGEKLHASWIESVLQGDPKTRMRPWLRARMPAFHARADALAKALCAAHGLAESEPERGPPEPDLVEVGALLGGAEGFGCGACHQLGTTPAYARFEFGANDLSATPERLHKEFYRRWMWDPRRVDPANRMPLYVDEDGLTRFDEHFDGAADQQFEAIWAWLRSLPKGG